jgi:hypothetical protein
VYENNTGGKVPGNPQNAVKGLRNVFTAVQVYQSRHNGSRPAGTGELLKDMWFDRFAYGLPADQNPFASANKLLSNPDTRYSDDPHARKHASNTVPYRVHSRRPDGTAIGGPKPEGTRDVVASTDVYVHQNVKHLPNQKTTSNPVGFYMVIWDDGRIQQIPYDKVLYVPAGPSDFHIAYPGETGIPPGALTYDEYYTRAARWKRAPRGKPGSGGQSYDSLD